MTDSPWDRPAALAGRLLQFVAAILLVCMMGLTVIDTFMRKVMAAPIASAFELTEMMLTLVIFAGLPLITASRGHVQVELIEPLLGRGLRRFCDFLIDLLVTAALAVVAWQLWEKGIEQADYGDTTSVLQIALAPVTYVMVVLAAVAAVISLVNAVLVLLAGSSAGAAARLRGDSGGA